MKAKLLMILSGLIIMMGLALFVLTSKIQSLRTQYSTAMNNFKAYEQIANSKIDSINIKNYELKLTKEQLEYSNDSIIKNLDKLRKELKIKEKNVERLEYILSNTSVRDSIFFIDTIFKDNVSIDTTLADKWRTLNLKMSFPNKIDISSTFVNELSVIVSAEKQTINPPSKIFFIRWFQRKQLMTKIDVIDNNPYASIKEQRFVEIVK